MKKRTSICLKWHDYQYYPYETKFAYREVESLPSLNSYTAIDGGIKVVLEEPNTKYLDRLVYFSRYSNCTGLESKTLQARLENGSNGNGSTKRQSTRYSVHGLHEYKGKFNPQIVRSILNWYNLPEKSQVIDPFCGSGTALIESTIAGFDSFGWDSNPMAIYITNAKLLALSADPSTLKKQANRILNSNLSTREFHLANDSRIEYLQKWFSKEILVKIEHYRSVIESESEEYSALFSIILSDLLRDYSLQEPSDLRIRRRKSPFPPIPIEVAFKNTIERQLQELTRTNKVIGQTDFTATAFQADGRVYDEVKKRAPVTLNAEFAITSPPYATALPYIDTQRLSLVWLDLLSPKDLRRTEEALIGSREAAESTLRSLKDDLVDNKWNLPKSVQILCSELQERVSPEDGFRRRAVPGLLYRYFSDMRKTFQTVSRFMKPESHYALIVGTNRTTIGGKIEYINTPELLADVATSVGWKFIETLNLETYKRYGIHAANAVQGETLLVLGK